MNISIPEAIDNLKRHKTRYFQDFGWDTTTLTSLELAIQVLECLQALKSVEQSVERLYCCLDKEEDNENN